MSDFDGLVEVCETFALKAIENGATNVEQAKEYMYKLNNEFRHDILFQNIFPSCFGIVICEIEIAKANACGTIPEPESKMEEVD